jgi:hypothetical protein
MEVRWAGQEDIARHLAQQQLRNAPQQRVGEI